MNIALPILLLIFGGLTFWLLVESSVKWYFKAACISVFCVFTIVFWMTIHSFLGWPAKDSDMPKKVLVHWVIVKEPDKLEDYDGNIYFLVESANKDDGNFVARLFGYQKDIREPRLFGLPYDRELHEKIESQIKPKLQSGKPVVGELKKKEQGKGKANAKGNSNGEPKKGGGSQSQNQKWEFHELRPSDLNPKPTD